MPSNSGTGSGAAGAGVGGAIVGGVSGLAGSLMQYYLQNKLMDKSYAQAVEQWQREARYMSPAAQMQRLKQAGLNPDLIYNQMQSDNGSYQPGSVPQAPSVASAVNGGMLAASQVELNQAQAEKLRADTHNVENQTSEAKETFGLRFQQMFENLGLTKENKAYVQKQTGFIDYQIKDLVSQIRERNSQTNINNQLLELYIYRAQHAKEIVDAEISKMWSEAYGNNAYAAKATEETRRLIGSYDSYLRQQKNLADLYGSQSGFYGELKDYYFLSGQFLERQIMYYPYVMASYYIEGQRLFKHTSGGALRTNSHGFPIPSANAGVENVTVTADKVNNSVRNFFGTVREGFHMIGEAMMGPAGWKAGSMIERSGGQLGFGGSKVPINPAASESGIHFPNNPGVKIAIKDKVYTLEEVYWKWRNAVGENKVFWEQYLKRWQ